jgi:Xaa-Pro dipeptidase
MTHSAQIDDLPYSFDKLDALMERAGMDVLLATSKHNVQYLLGGYRFIFFSAMDALGHSRYLPIFFYVRGDVEKTAYIANKMEGGEHAVRPFWVPNFQPVAWGSVDSAVAAVEHLKAISSGNFKIGIEPGFLPKDSFDALSNGLAGAEFLDATGVLERIRAIKSPQELDLLRRASEDITDAMQATIKAAKPGDSKYQIIERLRREETNRGLQFEYCLLTLGASHNRAASDQTWAKGDILSIDSGGNLRGYIGDICRVGVLGAPDNELIDLLAEVEETQQAAFSHVSPGVLGGDMIARAQAVKEGQPNASDTDFFAHGMGLISHEAPFLMTNHPVAYEGIDADEPFQEGMVISVETTMLHPTRGFIKIEDTLAITSDGYEMFGTKGRGWTQGNQG